jgi:hypothetical protein
LVMALKETNYFIEVLTDTMALPSIKLHKGFLNIQIKNRNVLEKYK